MESDYIVAMSRLFVDALFVVLLSQAVRESPPAETGRVLNRDSVRYEPVPDSQHNYRGSRARYHFKQPNGRGGRG